MTSMSGLVLIDCHVEKTVINNKILNKNEISSAFLESYKAPASKAQSSSSPSSLSTLRSRKSQTHDTGLLAGIVIGGVSGALLLFGVVS